MEIVDIHSHILPGVDDGSENMEETLNMLRIAAEEGITHMIATPHYRSGRCFVECSELEKLLQEVRELAAEEQIPISLYLGTEIYYRSGLDERLDEGSLATMNHTEYVLMEFAPTEDYRYIRNALEDMRGMGYFPILAHVERYRCLLGEPDKVEEIRNMGCQIQCNASSVTGEFGFMVKRYIYKLLQYQLVDYIGTDAHNTGRRSPRMQKCRDILLKKCGAEYAEALLYKNAMKNLLAMQEGCD